MSKIPSLDYQRHLFREKTLTSVTSNTRADGETFLRLAQRLGVHATVTTYPLDRARDALRELANDEVRGAAVLLS
jgi:propanol-preferring alcohol dehydrogenase